MLRMIVQMRIKIAANAAVFLIAAAALPASAASLTPVTYDVTLGGSSTSTLWFNDGSHTTSPTFTGVTTYPQPPSAWSVNAYTAGVQNSSANVHSSVSYPPIDPTVSASASAGSLPTGSPPGNSVSSFLSANVSASITYEYAFEVASKNGVSVPVTMDFAGKLILGGGGINISNGNNFLDLASITLADQNGNILKTESFSNDNGNNPISKSFSKQFNISTDQIYLISLFVSAQASSFSSNTTPGSATAFAEIDPALTCDPADPNCAGTTTNYSSDLATPLPSTWLMMLSGFIGFGFLAYRGTKKNSAALAAA